MSHALKLWLRRFKQQKALVGFLLLSLGVSVGGGAVALSLNRAVLWRELPFDAPEQLVRLQPRDADDQARWLSWRQFTALSTTTAAPFQAVAGYTVADFGALSEPGLPPEALLGTLASAELFPLLGIEPVQGRLPGPEFFNLGSERVVLISHELWQRRFRGAPDIVGRVVRLSGPEYLEGSDGAYRVIGVLPRELWLFWRRADLVLPLRASEARLNDPNSLLVERVVARLVEGANLQAAQALSPALVSRANSAGATSPVAAIVVEELQRALFADLRPKLLAVLIVAAVVFLLAAINVVIAATVQALQRRRETAIRLAIGAAPWRIFSEAVRDNAITAIAGAAIGAMLALALTGVVIDQVPQRWLSRVPGEANAFRFDGRVAAWLVAAIVMLIAVSGAAFYGSVRRLSPWVLLASATGGDGKRSSRWRSGLVAAEMALCAAVVITATVLVLQLRALGSVDLGVDADRTTAVWINLNPSKYADAGSRVEYYKRLLDDIGRLPGIEAAGGVDLPFHLGWQTTQTRRGDTRGAMEVSALSRSATPGYTAASGLVLVDGRWIDDPDVHASAPVVVVSESLARALWPGERAVGRLLMTGTGTAPADTTALMVIGVVSDTRRGPHLDPDRTLFRPVAQAAPPWLYVFVRSSVQSHEVAQSIGTAVWRVDPDQVIDGPWAVSTWVEDRTGDIRFLVVLTTILASLCAILAGAGLYGLSAFWVADSAQDLGVRRAVGADDGQIVGWFARRWAAVVFPGLVVGVLLQAAASRLVVAGIEGLHPPNWSHIVAGLLVIGACSVAAVIAPLRRALNTDATLLMRRD